MATASPPRTLSVQRLFGAAVTLKIAFAAAGYLFNSPVWLGTVLPLTVMVAYMYLGYYRRGSDISEERFADSCYYLGFIFTIASIIICLFDLPKMAPGKGMYEIAMRFGAAMVSTVLGMIVRVYLVGFRKDIAESVRDVETALVDATRAFTVQLNDTMRSMQQFEAQILDATKASVAGVQLQVEALGRNFAEALNRFYDQVNTDNKGAFEQMVAEVRTATGRLAGSVEIYSGGMRDHLQAIETKVTAFSDAVTSRLSSTTFPDDFFSSRLQAPLEQLKTEAQTLSQSVRDVARQVGSSSTALGKALETLHAKAEGSKSTLDAVTVLAEQQRVLLINGEHQLDALGRLASSLQTLEGALRLTSDSVRTNTASSLDLNRQIGLLAQDSSTGRGELKEALGAITKQIDEGAVRIHAAVDRLTSELPGLLENSVGNSPKVLAALQQIDALTELAEAIAKTGAESAAHLQAVQVAIGEQARGIEDGNQRLHNAHEKSLGTLIALLQGRSDTQLAPIQTLPPPPALEPPPAHPAELPRPIS